MPCKRHYYRVAEVTIKWNLKIQLSVIYLLFNSNLPFCINNGLIVVDGKVSCQVSTQANYSFVSSAHCKKKNGFTPIVSLDREPHNHSYTDNGFKIKVEKGRCLKREKEKDRRGGKRRK